MVIKMVVPIKYYNETYTRYSGVDIKSKKWSKVYLMINFRVFLLEGGHSYFKLFDAIWIKVFEILIYRVATYSGFLRKLKLVENFEKSGWLFRTT